MSDASSGSGGDADADAVAVAMGPQTRSAAMGAVRIKSLVSSTLDAAENNYGEWRNSMYAVLGRFDVRDHVDGEEDEYDEDEPPEHEGGEDEWRLVDATITRWIYITISEDLFDIIVQPGDTARGAWTALAQFFADGGDERARAIHLRSELHAAEQGDLTVDQYCRKFKALARALAAVDDQPISDEALTLQMIRGMTMTMHSQVTALVVSVHGPFPTFSQARTELTLQDIHVRAQAADAAAAAAAAAASDALL